MAKARGHKFGQALGNFVESALERELSIFAAEMGLYLDKKGKRSVRSHKKVTWQDEFGNAHDLDYVLERGGSAEKVGQPVAFIESAWRRYTKHSRAKAQEIQGAVLPLASHHKWCGPFLGCILAGVFTKGALDQLQSLGFTVLYFPNELIAKAFAGVGIDTNINEKTSETVFTQRLKQLGNLTSAQFSSVRDTLIKGNKAAIDEFFKLMKRKIERKIQSVVVVPLLGESHQLGTVEAAKKFLDSWDKTIGNSSVLRVEIIMRFSNGDELNNYLSSVEDAKQFLCMFESGVYVAVTAPTPSLDEEE